MSERRVSCRLNVSSVSLWTSLICCAVLLDLHNVHEYTFERRTVFKVRFQLEQTRSVMPVA